MLPHPFLQPLWGDSTEAYEKAFFNIVHLTSQDRNHNWPLHRGRWKCCKKVGILLPSLSEAWPGAAWENEELWEAFVFHVGHTLHSRNSNDALPPVWKSPQSVNGVGCHAWFYIYPDSPTPPTQDKQLLRTSIFLFFSSAEGMQPRRHLRFLWGFKG